MKITPIPNVTIPKPEDTIGNLRTRCEDQVHVTDILNYIEEVMYGAKSDADFAADGWDSDALTEAGFTWERLLEMAWKDRLGVRCGEIEREGIVGSPDGMLFDPLGNVDMPWVIEEYKFSWQSSANAFITGTDGQFIKPKWQRFINQVKSYCCLWGNGNECNRALFHVLFVCGDYKQQRGAQYKQFMVEFEEDELSVWFDRVCQVRDRILEKRKPNAI